MTGPNTFTYAVTNSGSTTSGAGTRTATLTQTANRFTFRGTGTNFTLQWGSAATTLDGVLNLTADQSVTGTATSATANDPRINLLARTAGNSITENFDPDGPSTTIVPALDKPSPTRDVNDLQPRRPEVLERRDRVRGLERERLRHRARNRRPAPRA